MFGDRLRILYILLEVRVAAQGAKLDYLVHVVLFLAWEVIAQGQCAFRLQCVASLVSFPLLIGSPTASSEACSDLMLS